MAQTDTFVIFETGRGLGGYADQVLHRADCPAIRGKDVYPLGHDGWERICHRCLSDAASQSLAEALLKNLEEAWEAARQEAQWKARADELEYFHQFHELVGRLRDIYPARIQRWGHLRKGVGHGIRITLGEGWGDWDVQAVAPTAPDDVGGLLQITSVNHSTALVGSTADARRVLAALEEIENFWVVRGA